MKNKIEQYDQKSVKFRGKLQKSHAESALSDMESGQIHGTYQFENLMLSYIRDGEVKNYAHCLQVLLSRMSCRRENWHPIRCDRQKIY